MDIIISLCRRREIMEKRFRFQYNTREFYRAYVEILKPFLKGVRDKEADVFAELLYFNYLKRDIPTTKDRFKIIMDSEIRKEIVDYLKISDAIFRNALSSLRRRELLTKDNLIPEIYLVTPTKGKFSISFEFHTKDK